MSVPRVSPRRSSRIHNVSSQLNHNSLSINGIHKSTRIQASIRASNRKKNTNVNGHRYSGQKRRNPEASDESSNDEQSSDDDEDTQVSDYHESATTHNKPSPQSQLSLIQLSSQSQSAKRRKLCRTNDKHKWTQKQSAIQRRSTRMRYRKLADETNDHRAEIVDPMTNNFIDKLVEQNEIYQDVCHPNEAFMDIEQAKNMSNILKEQTRGLANEQFTITPHDYIKSIYREFSEGNENKNDDDDDDEDDNEPRSIDWSAIGQRFSSWFLSVPSIQFMNGPLQQSGTFEDIKKKPRVVRQKKSFTATAPMIEPKKVLKQKTADKTETKSRVMHLRKTLRKVCEDQEGVNPFEFLINPDSYSQTIENLFDLSFIMKEGFAQMDVSQRTSQPVLSYVSSSERTRRHNLNKSNKENIKTNGQCIIKFNPQTFCNLIDVYHIKDSQIERADAMQMEDDESTVSSATENKLNGHCNNGYRKAKRKGNDKEEAD